MIGGRLRFHEPVGCRRAQAGQVNSHQARGALLRIPPWSGELSHFFIATRECVIPCEKSMRGIAGIVDFDPQPNLPEKVRGMLVASSPIHLEHCVIREADEAALGYARTRRLLPEDAREEQPLPTQRDAGVLITTAVLRNREELAAAFGWSTGDAATKPDSAFVLEAYERWGEAGPAHLMGIFSLAVWRPRERSLFCAVSRLGTHPLYFARQGRRFAFASSLGGLFSLPGVSRALDLDAFAGHFANVAHDSEATLYRDVRRICNAHALTVSSEGVRTWPYLSTEPPAVLRLRSDAEYAEAFRAQLTAAVRRSLRPMPGNTGLLLSGGLDSSAVAAIAGQLLATEGRRLHAFHVVPPSGNRYQAPLRELDESRHVRALQAHAPHIDFHFHPAQPQLATREAWDEHFADNFAPFTGLLSSDPSLDQTLADGDVSVLLDGIGGNHVVSLEALESGYLGWLATSGRWLEWWREIRGHARVYGRPLRVVARHAGLGPLRQKFRPWPRRLPPNRAIGFLHPDFAARTNIVERLRAFHTTWEDPPRDFRRHLHRVVNVWAGLHHGAVPSVFSRRPARYLSGQPLHDHQLANFCLSLPFEQQVRDGWDRRLLREAMRGLLPDEIRLRVSRGFLQPEFQRNFTQAEPMLREELERMGESRLVREVLDYDRVRAAWEQRPATAGFQREFVLVKCIVNGAFLRWHERHGGG